MKKTISVHVLQHVSFEGLGSIDTWLAQQHATVSFTCFFEAAAQLPKIDDVDFVIVLGGPMSVNDEAALPWLKDEKRFIAAAIAADKAVLGICLGSQLIASAMGKHIYPAQEKEIGWFPVFGQSNASDIFIMPATQQVFHWHGETFDLPDNATLLASSAVCRNQAFQLGSRVLGFQFHLEATPQSAASMIEHCAHELVAQQYVQSEQDLKQVPASAYAEINALMEKALTFVMREDHLR
jgi:GMP synthase-like glutamine amidotransferase